jgi:hypothetical protein
MDRGQTAMRYLRDEKGIALATSLLLTLISMIIVMTALYFIAQGTRMSGLQKRYQTALEASYGGLDILAKDVLPQTITGTSLNNIVTAYSQYSGFVVTSPGGATCFADKLKLSPSSWTTNCDMTDILNPKVNPDLKLTLKAEAGRPDYDVYLKIVETMIGNSEKSGGGETLIGHGVTDPGILTPQHHPYVYRIEIQGERQQNQDERAQLSVLYAY